MGMSCRTGPELPRIPSSEVLGRTHPLSFPQRWSRHSRGWGALEPSEVAGHSRGGGLWIAYNVCSNGILRIV